MGATPEALKQESQAIHRLQSLIPIHELQFKGHLRRPEQRLPTNNRELAQRLEVAHINHDANLIESYFNERSLELPTVFSIFTAGFEPPEDSEQIGVTGKDIFQNIPAPEIPGHSGNISLASIGSNGETMLIFQGRAHPYEWSNDPNGALIVGHQLQVLKELARRQRVYSRDPIFVLTYLTGVREGQILKAGDLGIILDDTEGTNTLHPGHGPRGILNFFVGDQFQAKMGRSCDPEVATVYVSQAGTKSHIGPAIVLGTEGATEYQSGFEVGAADAAFYQGRAQIDPMARKIFADNYQNGLAMFFGMGPTFELATLRQTFPGEPDFRTLPLVLATDEVGGSQSEEIDHTEVVNRAFAEGRRHRDAIVDFVRSKQAQDLIYTDRRFNDHSIKAKLQNL